MCVKQVCVCNLFKKCGALTNKKIGSFDWKFRRELSSFDCSDFCEGKKPISGSISAFETDQNSFIPSKIKNEWNFCFAFFLSGGAKVRLRKYGIRNISFENREVYVRSERIFWFEIIWNVRESGRTSRGAPERAGKNGRKNALPALSKSSADSISGILKCFSNHLRAFDQPLADDHVMRAPISGDEKRSETEVKGWRGGEMAPTCCL